MILRTIVTGAALPGLAASVYAHGYNPARPWHGVSRRAPYHGACRFIHAESWRRFKKVRRADLGERVSLPGGTWVYCEFSGADTLRRQSLSF